MMDPLQIEIDQPLEVPNFVLSSYDLDPPKSSSHSSSQLLLGSFTLKEEEIVDRLLIKNDEPTKLASFFQSSYGLDNPKSRSCNSSQALVGSFTLNEEEKVDPLTIKNAEPMKVSNFSRSSYGLDTPKSSYCNSSQILVGSFTLKEEGSFCNGRSRKKRSGPVKDMSSSEETIRLTNVFNKSKLCEKISLKTTVEIEKLTKRTIDENCCGKWRCSACGKIENSFYFLQLHKSTNCATGLSFNCEICCKEINNYSDFAIHYIEHEADKKKKCPICLCPNVNNIKEHVIVENHLSEDIDGFKFTDNEFQRSNQKAKPEVCFNSTIDGYCQDFNVDSLSKKSEKKVKKEYLSIVESTPAVKEKPNLRKRKENTIYVESSDSDMDDISDEEMDKYSQEASEVTSSDESDPEKMAGKMPPESYIGHVKAKNHASGKEPPQSEEVALESFGSRWKEMSLWFKKNPSRESSKKTHICKICSESFSLPISLSNHMKGHDEIEIQQCHFYCSKFNKKRNLEPVTNIIVRESNFNECGICKKTYVKRISLLRHLRRHGESRKYLCHICGFGFFRDIVLKMHLQRHTGDKNFTCDKCGKSFYSMSLLNQHLKKHTIEESGQIPEKIFVCEICNKKFETKKGHSRHMKKHNEGATHECGFCQRKFYTSDRLTEHMRTHTGEKPYECKICSNSFASKPGLNSHMKSHSEKRPYSCEYCSKTFKDKQSKNDHVNTHTGNRPYKCKQCAMRFGSGRNLDNHKKVHTRNPEEKKFREKKYSCNICSEVFVMAAYRDQHVALHANPNPFNCEFCSKSFNYKKNMVAHVQRWHPSCNPFRCKLCNKTYDTIRKIDVHINSRACVKNDISHKKSKNQDKSIEVDGNANAENQFICNICNEDFESVEEIQDHFNSSHKPS